MFKWLLKLLTLKCWKRNRSQARGEIRTIIIRHHCRCCDRVSELPLTKNQTFGCRFCSAVIFPNFPAPGTVNESLIRLYELIEVLQKMWSVVIEELAPPLPKRKRRTGLKNLDDEQFQRLCDFVQSSIDDVINDIWNEAGNLPMLAQDLKALKMTDLASERDELSCCICTDELKEGEDVLKLPCGHLHHANCISTWLESHSTCPVCRRLLRSTIF